jgi:propionyl-CoA carboxylase beta chain
MGAKGAVEILYKGKNVEESIAKYEEAFNNPLKAAERGYVDDIINPEDTRKVILACLEALERKEVQKPKKKIHNMPL